MDDSPLSALRMHGTAPGCDPEGDSCSSGAYVSNEESSLIQTLLQIRERADDVRSKLKTASGAEKPALVARLEELRGEWKSLSARRERAGTRKMAMLGHIPWHEAEWEE
jgi:hypothetical protein